MRVAQFVHRYPPALGGAEAWMARLSRHLADQGHDVTVWTTTAIDLMAFRERGHREAPAGVTDESGILVRRHRPALRWPLRRYWMKAASLLPIRRWQARTMHFSPTVPTMMREAREALGKPDVVHATAFPYSSILVAALLLAKRSQARFIVTPFLHLGNPADPNDRMRRAYSTAHLQWILRGADRVLVQTPTEAEAVRAMGIPSNRIVLQGLGVEPSECTGGDRDRARRAWKAGDRVVIGHLANQSQEKGTIDLLEAVAQVRLRGLPVQVVLAGPMMPGFERFWTKMPEADWITQLGPIDDATRRDFFAGIDVFALPSVSDSFGLVFLEAWANGKPVIGYQAGGVVDVIRHEKDGLLVDCGDRQALAAAIARLVERGEVRREFGEAGRGRLGVEFAWPDKLAIAERTFGLASV